MKAAKITVAGTTYFLVMDGEAMFTIRDIYGGTRLMLERWNRTRAKVSLKRATPPLSLQSAANSSAAGWDMSRGASRNATISRF